MHLGSIVIKACLEKVGLDPGAGHVDEVIMGQVLTGGKGQNPARQAAVNAGLPHSVPATTVNAVCGSGLKYDRYASPCIDSAALPSSGRSEKKLEPCHGQKLLGHKVQSWAVMLGVQGIRCGEARVVVCGGQESMSRALHGMELRSDRRRFGHETLVDILIQDGLTDAFTHQHMGLTAENVAAKYGVSRAAQDEFAAESQRKTSVAMREGRFRDEIVPVLCPGTKGETVEEDEFPRPSTTLEALAKLKPVFKAEGGTVTAGNASGLNDGAACLLLMSQREAKLRRISPLATIVSYAQCGVDPALMGIGPVPAVKAAVEKAGWRLEEVDWFELNEAFAAQSVAVIRELNLDPSKVNPNGGAIALGHPIGASGLFLLP
ncbi:unnamed protein product [Darwinula stevensoni]|uniref:Uncharacterized protein n=1 Tax=Darwinula stevensoni TaxID=69355 RepID=A0A7R8X946_9CRUS|nr:unnamed protein product [Darwinula stevensoni]CAG0889320.1 unnamed protein product [Darwinula stevensoni]